MGRRSGRKYTQRQRSSPREQRTEPTFRKTKVYYVDEPTYTGSPRTRKKKYYLHWADANDLDEVIREVFGECRYWTPNGKPDASPPKQNQTDTE